MECKNCELPLRSDYSYCSNCGAKIIRNPLTLKNLWYDFSERYFNVDNTFLRTFWDLIKKPEIVIEGYINGVRKKYLNPISYYAIALTLTGILLFLLQEFFVELTSTEWITPKGVPENQDTFDKSTKYQSLISVVSIPIYALISRLVFLKNKKFNYTGHIVLNIYVFAQYTIASFLVYVLFLILGFNFMKITYVGMLVSMAYMSYTLKRVYKLSLGKIIGKTLLFIFILIFLFIAITIVFGTIMFLTGGMEGLKNGGA